MNKMQRRNIIVSLLPLCALAACGGSDDASLAESDTGFVSIGITDAAVDDVLEVNVQFTGVTLKPQSGDEISIVFDAPKDFDLLTLTNGMTAELLPDTEVPAGPYNWIRLAVNAEFDNVFDSYAVLPTGQVELRVPSGSQTGLKLVSGFTVTQDRATNLVIDWDLRKALSDPPGQPGLHLRPALRVTDMAFYGTLSGSVDAGLVNDADCSNDLVLDTGNAVYLYSGMTDSPGDIGDATSEPLVTATVSQNTDGTYGYSIKYLPVGEYTAAFTCQASDDAPEVDDDIAFSAPQSLTINDGETTVVDF
ncbi:MAG: DUF4382 domain-containing protein [Woeseiaceae bacterium]